MKISHNENLAWRIIDGSAYIVTVKDSHLHILNEVGTKIWQITEKGIEFDKLLEKLVSEYDIELEKLKKDLEVFLEKLKTKGLIKIEDSK